MFKRRPIPYILIALIVPLILAACDSEPEQSVSELPTRVVIPTETATETFTSSPTLEATSTFTPTATFLATLTPTYTHTATFTFTPTPSLTPTRPSATPTITSTPTATRVIASATNTLTPIPTNTLTPTVTATSPAPTITNFQASAASVIANTPITLTWQAEGDIARIDQTTLGGVVQQTFSVPVTGQLPVTVPPSTEGQVIYRFVVTRGGQEAARSVPIIVQAPCATAWFFGTPPAGTPCPAGPSTTVTGKAQLFQNGVMFNATINGEDRVYGLSYGNGQYAVYTNRWDGTSTYTVPCGTAPTGFVDPQDVFNWAYHNTNGTLGLWCNPQGGIGWATTGFSAGVSIQYQFETGTQAFFVSVPGVGIVRMSGASPLGTWTRS